MKNACPDRREDLRLKLRAQRQLYARQFNTADNPAVYQPRSMTMRLLTGRTNLRAWLVAELLPLVVLHFLGKSGRTLLHTLQSRSGLHDRAPTREISTL